MITCTRRFNRIETHIGLKFQYDNWILSIRVGRCNLDTNFEINSVMKHLSLLVKKSSASHQLETPTTSFNIVDLTGTVGAPSESGTQASLNKFCILISILTKTPTQKNCEWIDRVYAFRSDLCFILNSTEIIYPINLNFMKSDVLLHLVDFVYN